MKKSSRFVSILIAVLMAINMVVPVMAYSESIEGITASFISAGGIRENESGDMTSDYDPETDTYSDEYFRYHYSDMDFVFTVTYDGGQTFIGDYHDVVSQFGKYPQISDDQSFSNQWSAGKHEVTVDFMGFTVKAEIEITASPVESISAVAKESLIAGASGQMQKDYLPEVGEETEEYFRYEVYNDLFQYTVIMENGDTFTGDSYEMQNRFHDSGWDYMPRVYNDQSYDNQWALGKHTVTVKFMGKTCESEVEVVKNPIDSISAVTVKPLTEGVNGWMTSDWTEQGQSPQYFKYNINFDTLEYTVSYDDGKTFVGNQEELQQKFGHNKYYVDIKSDQSYDNQWSVGKHTATVSFMGRTCEAEIEVAKSPVESISAVAVKTLSEGVNGYLASDYTMEGQTPQYFKYNLNFDTLEYTVIYDGGKTFIGNQNDIQQRFGNNQSFIDVSTNQSYDNQWGVGKHTVNINFMGKECTTEVEIVKCPIDSISAVAVKVLTEGVDGWMTSDWNMDGQSPKYFKYNTNYDTLEYTVTYDGDKIFTGNQDEIQRKFGKDSTCINITTDQSYNHQWAVGKHEVNISFLGKSCIIEIEVVKSPIESIEVSANRPLLYQLDGYIASDMDMNEYFKYDINDSLFSYRVIYDGGKSFTGDAIKFYNKFSCSPIFSDDQSFDNQWGIGKHSVQVSVAGTSYDAEIEIVENPYKSLQISGENELLLTFTKYDNSTVTAKILDFVEYGGGQGECGGVLTTDIGTFSNVRFSWFTTIDSADNSRDLQLTIGTLQSNILAKNNWLKMREYSQRIAYYSLAFERDTDRNILDSNGRITNDNINSIISLSYDVTGKLWSGDKNYITEGEHTYFLFDLDDVKETVAMVFDTAGVDFSGAKTDAASGKVMVEDVAIGGGTLKTTTTFDSDKNCWSSKTEDFDDNNQSVRRLLTITYDENNKVSSITETHDHKLIFHSSVDASCENDGSVFYCECDICGKLFTDETCSETITKQDTIIQSTGHNYVDTVVPPTTAEQGYTEHRCSKCGHSYKDNFVDVLSPKIAVSNSTGILGKTVKISVSIENNPGIATACFAVNYDITKLQLISAEDTGLLNDALFGGDLSANPYKLYWDDSLSDTNNIANGTIAELTFIVLDTSALGETPISISYIPDDVYNIELDNVRFDTVDGMVTVKDVLIGDVDGSGEITAKDASLLRRYYAGGWNTEIDLDAADVNGDGSINAKDITILRRYIAGGWNVELG